MPIGKRLLPIAALFGLSLGFACGEVGAAFSQDQPDRVTVPLAVKEPHTAGPKHGEDAEGDTS